MGEARAAVAAVIVAAADDVALTHSASDGLNLLVDALAWAAGDRVLTTRHEHPGGLGPLLALRARLGVEVEFVDLGDGGDDEQTIGAFAAALAAARPGHPREPRAVDDGRRAADPAAGRAGAVAGAVMIADGAQAAGAIPVSVEELAWTPMRSRVTSGCSGPRGWPPCGCAAASPTRLTPAHASFLSYEVFDPQRPVLRAGAGRFEATGYHRPSVVGLARSCGWISMYVGLPWAHERATRLAAGAADRLAAIPGVSLVTPRGAMATLVTFRIAGWPAAAAVEELGSRAFAILRDLPMIDALRISVGFWTTEEELDRFADAVELVAGHTPETIPPRRTLTILGSDDRPIG